MATITVSQLSESALTTFYNKDTISHTTLNSNFSSLRTTLNSTISQVTALELLTPLLAASNTWTGTTNTFKHIAFTSGFGISDTFVLIDSDNTGAAATCDVRMERGSSGADAYLRWNTTDWLFYGDAATTLAQVQFADGASANDGMTYQQGVKLTGTVAETVTGVKTFSSYPVVGTVYAAPTTDLQVSVKKYTDDKFDSLSTGGILQQTSTPAVTSGNLWIDTTVAGGLRLNRANGTIFVPVNGFHIGTSAPTQPTPAANHTWIDTTSTTSPSLKMYDGAAWKQVIPATIDAATTFTGAVVGSSTIRSAGAFTADATSTFTGVATFTAVPICTTLATTASQLTNKAYVDAASPKKYVSTAAVTIANSGTQATLIGSGVGSLTIAANTLIAGSVIVLEAYGIMSTDNNTNNAIVRLKIRNTGTVGTDEISNITVPTTGYFTVSTAKRWSLRYVITVRTAGASGTTDGRGHMDFVVDADYQPLSYVLPASYITIDTTAAQLIDFTWIWTNALAASTVTCQSFKMETYI